MCTYCADCRVLLYFQYIEMTFHLLSTVVAVILLLLLKQLNDNIWLPVIRSNEEEKASTKLTWWWYPTAPVFSLLRCVFSSAHYLDLTFCFVNIHTLSPKMNQLNATDAS